ncbi:MAG: hypothetical protein ACI9T9_000991 [Oleiphilaceae bacterium]|jgi:hypothetical protein
MLWKMYLKKIITKHITQINTHLIRSYISLFYTSVYIFLVELAVLKRFSHV